MQRVVVCAAIRDAQGQIICGARHFDWLMRSHVSGLIGYIEPWEQGFVDQRGEFMTREEAWSVATAAGQIVRRVGGDNGKLFSENLY